MACLRLVTFLRDPPERSSPRLASWMARPTFLDASVEYFRPAPFFFRAPVAGLSCPLEVLFFRALEALFFRAPEVLFFRALEVLFFRALEALFFRAPVARSLDVFAAPFFFVLFFLAAMALLEAERSSLAGLH